MDEYTADAFANRDEPIPLISVTADDLVGSSSEADTPGKRARLKKTLSGSRLRDKARPHAAAQVEKLDSSPGSASIQDRLFAKLLERVIPSEDIEDGNPAVPDPQSSKYIARPAFSLPVMKIGRAHV